jgi:hypothetical protein
MRVSIAIEIAEDRTPRHPSVDYAGPLAPFIAQLAAVYLQAPTAWALERRAHAQVIAGYQTSSPGDAAKFDRSV